MSANGTGHDLESTSLAPRDDSPSNFCNYLMHVIFVPLCVLCFFVDSLSAVKAQDIKLPPVTRVTLPNGIRLVLMEYRRAPTITITALFPGGDTGDPAGKAGTASLTAALLRKGTEKRTAVQIAEEVDFLGASLGASGGNDLVSVSIGALSRDTDRALEILTDVIRHSTFPAEELERERQLTLNALQSLAEDPGAVANRVENEVVYAGHPYSVDATITSVKAISRDDVGAYYKRFIVPNQAILVAVGAIKTSEFVAKLKSSFGDWEKGPDEALNAPKVTVSPRKLILVDKADATQTQVRFGRTAFARTSKDYFPAQVAETILGGGFTSRLIEEIRVNRSLTYGIASRFSTNRLGGSFSVTTFTKIETTRKLLDAVNEVLRNAAAKGFSAEELQKAKNYLSGMFAIRVQTPEAIAGELGSAEYFGLPPNYLQTYLAKIRAVTLADANRVVKSYASPDGLSLVLVAPAKSVGAQLKGLGAFETKPVESIAR